MEGAGTITQVSASIETPSGKGKEDENFPVGSFLIRRDLRPHVHAFYRFAREADDIADNGDLTAEEKVRRLDRMAEVLEGAPGHDTPSAFAMRQSLAATGVTAQHSHDILHAFRMDATKLRYKDWGELMHYCRYSASPVGRQLLDLHGESQATWPANDALCSALQVLNHLQDCAKDYHELDRVYLPDDDLANFGSTIDDLTKSHATPGLRKTLDRLLEGVDGLVATARTFSPQIRSPGLRRETAIIVNLAERLTQRLKDGDPIAGRVKLTKSDFALALLTGLWRGRRMGA